MENTSPQLGSTNIPEPPGTSGWTIFRKVMDLIVVVGVIGGWLFFLINGMITGGDTVDYIWGTIGALLVGYVVSLIVLSRFRQDNFIKLFIYLLAFSVIVTVAHVIFEIMIVVNSDSFIYESTMIVEIVKTIFLGLGACVLSAFVLSYALSRTFSANYLFRFVARPFRYLFQSLSMFVLGSIAFLVGMWVNLILIPPDE